jgi:glutamate N-acetyltransferase/amino-acid N-acetyltransferase
VNFFGSRWVTVPGHVRELGGHAGLPDGFRAAGVACGIKPSGKPDLGLLVCDAERPVSAVSLTTSAAPAAPVQIVRERCRMGALRGLLVNSGCANAATGSRGLEDAAQVQGAAAAVLGTSPEEVALASTGGISHYLPVDRVLEGILEASTQMRSDGDGDFQRAIETTDAFEKRANLEVTLDQGSVGLTAQCKGAGMISPRFATMLCFVETDAALAPGSAEAVLARCVRQSFDRISVDGQLSTNDTVVLIASGASGVRLEPEGEDALRFGEALEVLLRELAIKIVADGEGARRLARLRVAGAEKHQVEHVARAVANSPLVKAALNGGDPNWGRILQAVGGALAGSQPTTSEPLPADRALPVAIAVEGIEVCARGAALEVDEPVLREAVARQEVEYEVRLPGEGASAEVFFSDLSHDYVTLNAEYTT